MAAEIQTEKALMGSVGSRDGTRGRAPPRTKQLLTLEKTFNKEKCLRGIDNPPVSP